MCSYDIKKYKKSQHEKSKFHQDNLARQLNPDAEALPEPDEIKVVDGKKTYYCYACKCSMMCLAWKNHVEQQTHIEAIRKKKEQSTRTFKHIEYLESLQPLDDIQ